MKSLTPHHSPCRLAPGTLYKVTNEPIETPSQSEPAHTNGVDTSIWSVLLVPALIVFGLMLGLTVVNYISALPWMIWVSESTSLPYEQATQLQW